MSAIFGVLGVEDTEADYLDSFGSELIFDAINEVLGYHNADLAAATKVFVAGETEKFQMRWLSPGSGLMTPVGQDPHAPGPSVGRYGEWNVGFPLTGYEESFSASRIALAHMTLQELDANIDTILERNIRQHRVRILTALFEDTARVFADIVHGNITLPRLANTDGSLFPCVPGAVAEADDDHFRESTYTVANITVLVNPLLDLRPEILEHFGGRMATGTDILYLHGIDQTAPIEAIASFTPIGDTRVNWGEDTDLSQFISGIPGMLYGRCEGCWVSQWDWIPATFGLAVHLQYPPLLKRVHPKATGLPRGLSLVARDRDHPLESAFYADYFGYAVCNRLSAACIEVSGDAPAEAYAPPAAYAE